MSTGHEAPQAKSAPASPRPFHVELLQRSLQLRKKRNPRYSLRAFSHFLGLDPAALSRILAGKQDLSLRAACKVVQALKLSDKEKQLFQASVAAVIQQRTARFFASSAMYASAMSV